MSGDQLRDEGIARVLDNNEAWRQSFFAAADTVLARDGQVTSEAVLEICGPPPGHFNAIGGAMRRFAIHRKLHNGGYIKSTRPKCHSTVIIVWTR